MVCQNFPCQSFPVYSTSEFYCHENNPLYSISKIRGSNFRDCALSAFISYKLSLFNVIGHEQTMCICGDRKRKVHRDTDAYCICGNFWGFCISRMTIWKGFWQFYLLASLISPYGIHHDDGKFRDKNIHAWKSLNFMTLETYHVYSKHAPAKLKINI